VLIDGSELDAVRQVMKARFTAPSAAVVSTGLYRLMWDLAKSDL
jgi:hypothetical protein